MHIGHAFSYTHPDLLARFWRMRGKEVFYPVGWDDNGLPTERRVQNYYGVRCEPALPYDPDFTPPGGQGRAAPRGQVPVSRRNFVELCLALTEQDEFAYAQTWRRLGLSMDWSISYRTIDAGAQAVSQRAFLRDLATGEAYLAEGPSLWDVTFGSAVAQAELEDREIAGHYYRIAFEPDGSPAARAARCWSRPPGPSCCPPAWRWSRIPMTSGTPACSGERSVPRSSASACRSSRTGSPTRPRAPASRWSARSATPRTSPGGGTWAWTPAR